MASAKAVRRSKINSDTCTIWPELPAETVKRDQQPRTDDLVIRRAVAKRLQRALCCPCGREKILANGLCATCYTLKRQDTEYFGGHREAVLARDGYRCQIPNCTTLKRGKRSVAVHHRVPGNSDPKLMITLCLPDHARVTRTQFVQDDWHPLLRELWREQHPSGHEQTNLNFDVRSTPAQRVPLFVEEPKVS